MRIADPRSIIVILIYFVMNAFIVVFAMKEGPPILETQKEAKSVAPEYTRIENLGYFHLKNGVPQMSLAATEMRSQGEETAEFVSPKGVYNYEKNNEAIRYQGQMGSYLKARNLIKLNGDVKINSSQGEYLADSLNYFFKKDLVLGRGNVKFEGDDPKTRDHFVVTSKNVKAYPQKKFAVFKNNVKGLMEPKKKYEGKMRFSSEVLELDGFKSLAHLEQNVVIDREAHHITAGKADIYFDNYNKSLKYFVLNDDVKATETLTTPQGPVQRKTFSERLEGFGREQKMVLSGAPRVEQGKDVIKGYRITIRENADLIEVDDAMSDVQVKRKNN